MTLTQRLTEYISACFTGLWVQSHEHEDALTEIAGLCRDQNWRLAIWDIASGLQIPGQNNSTDAGGSDPLAAIRSINALASPDGRFTCGSSIWMPTRPSRTTSNGRVPKSEPAADWRRCWTCL
jgi:hypothetical protein